MDIDKLLNTDRPLTNEEMAFIEQQALELARQLAATMEELSKEIEKEDPELAAHLLDPARRTVKALEGAAAIPWEGEDQ